MKNNSEWTRAEHIGQLRRYQSTATNKVWVLMDHPSFIHPEVGYYLNGRWMKEGAVGDVPSLPQPSHWMPLPGRAKVT